LSHAGTHAQTYLAASIYFENPKCADTVAVYELYQLSTCLPLGSGPSIFSITNSTNVTLYTFSSPVCSGSPSSELTFELDGCDTSNDTEFVTSLSYSLSSSLTPPSLAKNAFGYSVYPSCSNKTEPLFRVVYNPSYCFSLGNNSVVYGTCNSTTSSLFNYPGATCTSSYTTDVIPLGTCYDGAVNECYGNLSLYCLSLYLFLSRHYTSSLPRVFLP
jgi:hypothetical protein